MPRVLSDAGKRDTQPPTSDQTVPARHRLPEPPGYKETDRNESGRVRESHQRAAGTFVFGLNIFLKCDYHTLTTHSS